MAASLTLDLVVDEIEAEENAAFIDQQIENVDCVLAYSQFDCNGVTVDRDMAVGVSSETYIGEGRNTQVRVDAFNEHYPDYAIEKSDLFDFDKLSGAAEKIHEVATEVDPENYDDNVIEVRVGD